jgi:hypothetical protein
VTRADNQQMLVEYLENMPLGEGQVGIIANYIIPNGTLLDIVDVIGSEQKILPVLITKFSPEGYRVSLLKREHGSM